jgi:hypothetical protein
VRRLDDGLAAILAFVDELLAKAIEVESWLSELQDLSAVRTAGRRWAGFRFALSEVRGRGRDEAYHELKVQVLNWWHRGHSKVRSSVSSLWGIILLSVICIEVICVEHSGQAGRWVTPWTGDMIVVAGMRCTLTD